MEGAFAALGAGLALKFAGVFEPGFPTAGAAQGVVLGIAICLATAVKAEEVRFMACTGVHKVTKLLLRHGRAEMLGLKTLSPDIGLAGMVIVVPPAIGAAQVGLAIIPALDAEAAAGAGEIREFGHINKQVRSLKRCLA